MAATFELTDGTTTIDLMDATNYRLRGLTFGNAPVDRTLAGISLRGYRYRVREISGMLHIKDTSAANLELRLRNLEAMLSVAKTRQILGHGTTVLLKTQVGNTNADDIEYRVLSGTVTPAALLREPAAAAGDLPTAELKLLVEPLGRLTSITHAAVKLENEVDGNNINFVDLFGAFNGYLVFDAVNEEVRVTDQAAIQDAFDGGGSIEAWVFPKSDGENDVGVIVSKSDGSTNKWVLHVSSESAGFVKVGFSYDFSTTDGVWTTDSAILPLNKWSRVSLTYNNGGTSNVPIFEVDGVVADSSTTTAPVGTRVSDVGDDLFFGDTELSSRTWDGYIDDVRLWDDIRTPTEILDNAFTELVGTEAGLVGYWPCNDSDGTNVADLTSNGNDGTITNATFGIADSERAGDEEGLLNIKVHDPAGTAWGGSKRMWIAKRSGSRRTDAMFKAAADSFNQGTDPYSGNAGSFAGDTSGLATNASGGASDRIRWTVGAVSQLTAARSDVGSFQYDFATPPAGLFRVLARVSVEFDFDDVDLTRADFKFALGYVFGGKTVTPVAADELDLVSTTEDEWEILDLGELAIPPIGVPTGFTSPTLNLRVHCIVDGSGQSWGTETAGNYIEWNADHIFLMPVDEGLVIVDSVATADRTLIDGQSDTPGVYILNSSDVVQKFATKTGGPFPVGPEPTRIHVIRDDVGDPSLIQFTVTPTHIPQLTGY